MADKHNQPQPQQRPPQPPPQSQPPSANAASQRPANAPGQPERVSVPGQPAPEPPPRSRAPGPVVPSGPARAIYHGGLKGQSADEYLLSQGWGCLGTDDFGRTLWRNPHIPQDQKPQRTTKVVLPVQGGGSEVIWQMTGPAIPWDYDTQSALILQREYERTGKGLPGLVAQKEAELENLRQLLEVERERKAAAAAAEEVVA